MRLIGRALLSALLLLSAPAFADDVSNGSYSTTDGGNNASPPNGWPAGMFPNQVEPSARANMGAVKRWWERANPTLSTTGSAGAYVITPSNTAYPTAYTQGEVICGKANFTSVGSDTLNVNGLGAKPIYTNLGSLTALTAGAIFNASQFCVSYDGALNAGSGGWQLISATIPGGFLKSTNNLSDVGSASTSRTNLGLGNAATKSVANNSNSTVPTLDGSSISNNDIAVFNSDGSLHDNGTAITSVMQKSNNLSDLTSAATARGNLSLGSIATHNVTISTSAPSGGSDGDIWFRY